MPEIGYWSPTLAERYWAKVAVRGPDECWPWTACAEKDYGHGQVYVGRKTDGRHTRDKAHRIAWMFSHGWYPGDWVVRHRCDNPPCQNPAHLQIGTHADNAHDRAVRGRGRSTKGETSPRSKITEAQALQIISLRRDGETLQYIGIKFGIGKSQVGRIARGQQWQHLQGSSTEGAGSNKPLERQPGW